MRVVCLADLHGDLPNRVPKGDCLAIAGDICPDYNEPVDQLAWLDKEFRTWLEYHPIAFVTWGNHDFGPEQFPEEIEKLQLPCHVLVDSDYMFEGYRFYGSPWTQNLPRWAFQKKEAVLDQLYRELPVGIDVLITHSPPRDSGDMLLNGEKVGNLGLRSYHRFERKEWGIPQLHVFGHIHEGKGLYIADDGLHVNAAWVDEYYRPTGKIEVVNL